MALVGLAARDGRDVVGLLGAGGGRLHRRGHLLHRRRGLFERRGLALGAAGEVGGGGEDGVDALVQLARERADVVDEIVDDAGGVVALRGDGAEPSVERAFDPGARVALGEGLGVRVERLGEGREARDEAVEVVGERRERRVVETRRRAGVEIAVSSRGDRGRDGAGEGLDRLEARPLAGRLGRGSRSALGGVARGRLRGVARVARAVELGESAAQESAGGERADQADGGRHGRDRPGIGEQNRRSADEDGDADDDELEREA